MAYADGPVILERGPTEQTVRLGDLASLLCVIRYQSHPKPTVTWTHPELHEIHDDYRYNLLDDEKGIRLEFPQFSVNDEGTYVCVLTVKGENVSLPNGTVVPGLLVSPPKSFYITAVAYSE